jgi:Protein kinase domain
VETLAERIARDGPVNELDAIGWAIRLAKRLEALHSLGVAHGSVSPACIIAAGQDRNARAYLADVQHTTSTPAFQSPERILGGDISAADDVWALASTLYALLTGQTPFQGAHDAEVRQKILAATPPPLAVYDVGDDDLQHILDNAFAREFGKRTTSIAAFRRALEEWHPDRGVANLPPLEDEDSTNDDDDGARTMMVRDTGGYLQQKLKLAAVPVPIPKVNEDDDDDDNIRTMMRSMPQDDLAAIIARAQGGGGAAAAQAPPAPVPPAAPPASARGAPGPLPRVGPPPARPQAFHGGAVPRPLPAPAAPPAAPRPGGGQPHPPGPPFGGRPAISAPAFGGRAAPPPVVNDDDDEDDNIRTVMRSTEQILAEDSHDVRTMLLQEQPEPGAPSPAAMRPAAGAPPPAREPAPAPTMALPVMYDAPSPGYGPPGHDGGPPAGPGRDGGYAHSPGPPPAPPGFPMPMHNGGPPAGLGMPAPQGGFGPGPGYGGLAPPGDLSALEGGPAQGMAQPLQAGPPPNLMPAPPPAAMEPARSGSRGLLIVAAIVALLIAAGLTFLVLRMRAG